MLFLSSIQAKADGFAFLTVSKNGETIDYKVSDIRKITFDETNMILNLTNGDTEILPFSVLTEMTIGDGSTGISLVGMDKTGLELKNGSLSVDMKDDGTVILYDSAGKKRFSQRVKAGKNSISVSHLPKGVYIVKVNGDKQKFLNK